MWQRFPARRLLCYFVTSIANLSPCHCALHVGAACRGRLRLFFAALRVRRLLCSLRIVVRTASNARLRGPLSVAAVLHLKSTFLLSHEEKRRKRYLCAIQRMHVAQLTVLLGRDTSSVISRAAGITALRLWSIACREILYIELHC